ncbi:hypothetical protein SEA_GIBBLES_114 [Gordonia phage Gibbles]|nr:hypothetical protein SEA_GIBBLES_114 [Gordonia phage Gibbles]
MNPIARTKTKATVEFENVSDVVNEIVFIGNMNQLFSELMDAKSSFARVSEELLRDELENSLGKLQEFFSELSESVQYRSEKLVMPNPIETDQSGTKTWKNKEGDTYLVTGVDVNGKRFKPIVCNTWFHASCINLYRGSRWLVRDGKRYLINRV